MESVILSLPSFLHLMLAAVSLCVARGYPGQPAVLGVDKSRLEVGEAGLRELEVKAEHSPCWRDAVARLDLSCKKLNDIEQSRLAVAFANCHLSKSGRTTYPCTEEMSILECTEGMDGEAYQTYTHFFTHTGHICYFIQIELWQGRTEGLIGSLSQTSSEALDKLEQSLDYHREMEQRQETALRNQDRIIEQDQKIALSVEKSQLEMEASFSEMSVMAEQQKAVLGEMFGSLQSSVEGAKGLMSLLVVEFVGWGTVVWFSLAWVVVMLLPQFHYSRFKLMVGLIGEGMAEVCVRRVYSYLVIGGDSPPSDLSYLHSILWLCRYTCVALSLLVYVWEWYSYQDYGERNYRLLAEIRQLLLRTGDQPHQILSPQHTGNTTHKAPIPLPYAPLRAAQPVSSHPPPPYMEEFPDNPDSTESPPHQEHPSHPHTSHPHTSHYVLSSDDDGERLPDNDRAASRSKVISGAHRVQRSSRQPPPESGSLLLSCHLSSDDDEPDNSHSLTRSPIHSSTPGRSHTGGSTSRSHTGGNKPGSGRSHTAGEDGSNMAGLETAATVRSHTAVKISGTTAVAGKKAKRPQRKRTTTSSAATSGGGGVREKDGEWLASSDPEPEKEVSEEKEEHSVSSRRSLRPSDHMTGQLATPSPRPPPRPVPKPHFRSRSATPLPPARPTHRYNLRERTPQPDK